MAQKQSRWYPTVEQLKSPERVESALRQVLQQHYALQDKYDALMKTQAAPKSGSPAGAGPSDTMLLGLRVAPVDTQTLANGATLKFDAANGNFHFV